MMKRIWYLLSASGGIKAVDFSTKSRMPKKLEWTVDTELFEMYLLQIKDGNLLAYI